MVFVCIVCIEGVGLANSMLMLLIVVILLWTFSLALIFESLTYMLLLKHELDHYKRKYVKITVV
jgi:hypothetical protein